MIGESNDVVRAQVQGNCRDSQLGEATDQQRRGSDSEGAGEFSKAFEKGDAKAITAMWVEHGEYEDDQNKTIRARCD